MDGYLSKPIDINALTRSLQDFQPRSGTHNTALKEHIVGAETSPNSAPFTGDTLLGRWRSVLGAQPMSLHGIVERYIGDAAELIAAMDTALDNANYRELGRAAHKFASGSAFIGAQTLAAHCQHLERAADAEAVDRAHQLVQLIKADYTDVVIRLQHALASDNNSRQSSNGANMRPHD